ncbi:hypothetical protein [Burkholderia ubonensis]|uniref:hypothetical protein n=1 Tax=Burkholderia ubonensis TaxID=101571 RepID=UPI0012FC711F|nr:hypothetical protein [Burkholderia ubonensis]
MGIYPSLGLIELSVRHAKSAASPKAADAPDGGRLSRKIARDESVDGLAPQAAHRRRFHRRKKARTKAGFLMQPGRAPDFYANE